MNNEEKILQILMEMQAEQRKTNERLDKLEQGQNELRTDVVALKEDVSVLKEDISTLKQGQNELRTDVVALKEDVEIIKEEVRITRSATNTLLDWAEDAQIEVKIPLYKKAK
ncbi:hypothetical protein [Anaerotruncus colihominis]|uniref:hypothetical protein n=1 Tax=Anaerotruncus colihominis TaxID=169435 RepID=UPI00189ABABB|nr:hypothetical protein [Anaerotruncus colihominis]